MSFLRVLKSSTTLAIPHRRWLTRKRSRAGIKRLTTLQLTSQRTHSFAKLPRELRDEILLLAMHNGLHTMRHFALVSRPDPTIQALTQVSRSVRT